MIDATIIVPQQYLGNIIKLCEEKRGRQQSILPTLMIRALS